MTKKVKTTLAIGLQLAMIGAIGDFVKWPYMNYVFIGAGISIGLSIIFFIWDSAKE